jgi:uncharacterized protein YlxW (UPF0749 family)
MSIGAQIDIYGTPCTERQKLGVAMRRAIDAVYEQRGRVEAAQRRKQYSLAEEVAALQAARATLLTAERQYDQHVLAHGCTRTARAAAASH